jgi:hypothetical protein
MRLEPTLVALLLAATSAHAQLVTPDPDWKEAEAPPPPALRTDGLIPLDVPRSALRFCVDPASVAVGSDGIVRYVVVATSSSGAVNAMYEGIRCTPVSSRCSPVTNPARAGSWQAARSGGNCTSNRCHATVSSSRAPAPASGREPTVRRPRSCATCARRTTRDSG